jgi:VWFA-related protein
MPLLILAALAFAADFGSQDETVFRANTHLVQLNVIVRDKHGPVTNLDKADFVLTESGKSRPISVFSVHKRTEPSSAPAEAPVAPAPNTFSNHSLSATADTPPSVTMILLDRLNTLLNTSMGGVEQTSMFAVGHALETGKQQLLKYLNELDPKERVAVYSLGESLTVLSDFTGDRNQLKKIIEEYHATSLSSREVVAPTGVNVPNMSGQINGDRQVLAGMANANRAQTTMAALIGLAAHVAGIPGRKNLVWLTSDLVIPAAALGRVLSRYQIAIYPVDVRGLQPFAMERTQADADARAHDGGAWRGGPGFGAGPTVPVGISDMQALAEETGGRAFVNNNDLTGAIRQALDDGAGTYTIGFYVDQTSLDGKFHDLKVHVKRSGLDVRTQKGYFALNNAAAGNDLSSALISPLESTAIRISAKVHREESGLVISGLIDLHDLGLEQEGDSRKGTVAVELVQQDAVGTSLVGVREDLHLQFTRAEYEAKLTAGVPFQVTLKPVNGLKTLRVVVTDRARATMGSLIIPVSEIR